MKNKFKILLVHKFHRLTGGADVFYFEVGRVLKEHGHEVAYFSTEHDENSSEGRLFTVENPDYSVGSVIAKLSAFSKVVYSKKNKELMLRAIEEFEPDVIHAFAVHVHLTPSVLEAAKIKCVPVVMSCNDYKHICPNYKLYDGNEICESCKGGKFYNAILKSCCHSSLSYSLASSIEAYTHERKKIYSKYINKYLFASEFMLNKTKDFWGGDFEAGILKNPFDATKYHPKYGGEYGLYFGRIIGEKGVKELVLAASTIEVPIKIVGDGPDLEAARRLAADIGADNVEFTGALWGEELDMILMRAAFVIVPSLWHENFPYVIFQAFAFGKPVLGSNRGGIPELVGNNSRGLIFDPNDQSEFSKKLVEMFSQVPRVIEMGKSARDYVVREFADEVFYSTLIEHYRSVLD